MTGGLYSYECLFDGTIFSFNSVPKPDIITLCKNEIPDKIPIQFKETDSISFELTDDIDIADKTAFVINLDIVFKAI